MDADILAPLGPLVELAHARERRPGAIGVWWQGGRAVAVNAYRAGLTALPALAGLTALVRLDVGENQLVRLPALPAALRELYIHDNAIEALPPLPPLAILDANRNRLAPPPLADLAFAYLAGNGLAQLPPVARIAYLNVSQNPLGTLALADDQLRELRAEQAALTRVTLAAPALRELSLRGNQLTTLGLATPALETLDLRGNQLDTLPAELRAFPLRKLDLRWNPLRAAPPWLDELSARGCLVYR